MAGFHEHFVRRASAAQRRHFSVDALLVPINTVIHAKTHGAFGGSRKYKELLAQGIPVGKARGGRDHRHPHQPGWAVPRRGHRPLQPQVVGCSRRVDLTRDNVTDALR